MSNSTKAALKKFLGCIVLIALILPGLQPPGAYAAVPKLDQIRVGLFFHVGQVSEQCVHCHSNLGSRFSGRL